ncbi:MAG: M20/M25/M40 family metallo-hydrolase [Phycisphaeraceae bacterium]|nr:M20/M25/M40 family metallo-hydrolase [Phycisphaeraceae bacterium]
MPLSSTERRLADAIASRRDSLLADLRLHVNTPTGPGSTDGIDETRSRLADRLRAIGAAIEEVPGQAKPGWLYGAEPEKPPPPATIGRSGGSATGKSVLIAGHLDTVHDVNSPFRELKIAPDAKTATGPGCVDMKGGLVIAVAALETLHEFEVSCAWSFLMTADEETGSYCSERTLRREAERHEVGLALEPALPGGALAVERLGSGQFMIEARGQSAHVGRDFERGISAVTALAHRIVAAASIPDPAHGRILSIGPIDGGRATNAVPDLARAWGNVRYPTQQVADDLERMLLDLETTADELPHVRVLRSFNRPAKPLTPEVDRLAHVARSVAEDLGQKLPFAATGGVCDGNILQAAGLPTIDTVGVRGGGLHTSQEWIDLDSLVERCQLLTVLIGRLCGAESSHA